MYSYVGCSVVYIRAVLSCPVLLSPHEYGLVQFSSVSFPRLEFIRVRFSDEEQISPVKFSGVKLSEDFP